MDAFEARLKFINLLKALQPSHQSLSRAAAFAIANAELQEDLTNCIAESLAAGDLNARANIFCMIEVLLGQAVLAAALATALATATAVTPHPAFVAAITAKMPRYTELVVPTGPTALINLNCAYVAVKGMCTLLGWDYSFWNEQYNGRVLTDADMERIEAKAAFVSQGSQGTGFDGAWQVLLDRRRQSKYERAWLVKYGEFKRQGAEPLALQMSKEQILSRLEADRERNKRAKESLWMVERADDNISLAEFRTVYNSHGALTAEDLQEIREINETAADSYAVLQS